MIYTNTVEETYIQQIAKKLNVKNDETGAHTLLNIIKQIECIPYVPFPIAFHTVDIIVYDSFADAIVLGKKKGKEKYQIPGGFIDPGETAEQAAIRELEEETGLKLDINKLKYLGSFVIDDERYENSPHKITTSLFTINVNSVDGKIALSPNDDLVEVKWKSILNIRQHNLILPKHKPLFKAFYHE